jgi:hypothetical protein
MWQFSSTAAIEPDSCPQSECPNTTAKISNNAVQRYTVYVPAAAELVVVAAAELVVVAAAELVVAAAELVVAAAELVVEAAELVVAAAKFGPAPAQLVPHQGPARFFVARFGTPEHATESSTLAWLGQEEPPLDSSFPVAASPEKSCRTAVNPPAADPPLVGTLLAVPSLALTPLVAVAADTQNSSAVR